MKHFFLLLFIFYSKIISAQDVLIPYKKGNQFGLCDRQGKIMLQPQYNKINWLKDEYFMIENKIVLNDTLETAPHRYFLRKNDTVIVTGLIYKGKEIIANQPYENYRILTNKCIIATCDTRYHRLTKEQHTTFKQRDKFVSLLNIYGKNLYEDNFRRLTIEDTLLIDAKNKKPKKLFLFKSENFKWRSSLFLYDIDKQCISEWLLKDVQKISLRKMDRVKKIFTLDYLDSNNNKMIATINYSSNKFVVLQQDARIEDTERKMGNGTGKSRMDINEIYDTKDLVAVQEADSRDINYPKPAFKPYYKKQKDSLLYFYDENKSNYINTGESYFYFTVPDAAIQYDSSVIYQKNNKYGLVFNGNPQPNIYDSLFYFGGKFLAYINDGSGFKCGILYQNGNVKFPLIYDSIQGKMKEYTLEFAYRDLALQLTEKKEEYYGYKPKKNIYVKKTSDKILVFKNGKCGIINLVTNTVIPIQYDLIADNGTQYSLPRTSNYIILKNDNKYGITSLVWDKDTKGLKMTNTIEPIFTHLPLYYYKDYYGVKDFKLFALYNNNNEFIGYVNENGFVYAENN